MSHPSRVRVTGPLISFAEGFAAQLAKQDYRPNAAAISYSFWRTSAGSSLPRDSTQRRSPLRP
jgi:hypothetical protein